MKTLQDSDPRSLQEAQWLALPNWARLYMLCIGLPSWGWLAWVRFHDNIDPIEVFSGRVALALFVSAVILNIVLVARAYWRREL